MRTISVLALVAWAVAAPSALRAAELTFSVDGNAEYDSNVFRSSRDEDDEYLFRLTPGVRLSDDHASDLRYALTYQLPVEFAVQNSELNDVDQRLGADVLYHVTDRFSVFAGDDFRYLRSELLTNFEETRGGFDSLLVNEQRDRILLNSARGGGSYQFTPRLAGTTRFDQEYYNPSRDDRATTNAYIGTGNLQYALTPKHKVGGGVRAQWQTFDDTEDIVGSNAQSYSVFGSWEWAVTERIGLEVAVGPALIRNEQDDPNATEVRPLIPSKNRGPFTAGEGFIDADGNDIPEGTVFEDGALLVGNFGNCSVANIDGTPARVVDGGKSCPLNVVLDRSPGSPDVTSGLIAEIEGATTTLTNADPKGESTTDLTVFALVTGRVDWTPTLHSALSYRRDQGTASGLGGTVVSDLVTLVNTYEFTEKWNFSARGEFSLRKSVDEATRTLFLAQPVTTTAPSTNLAGFGDPGGIFGTDIVTQRSDETNIDTMRWGFAGRVTHFLTRNTSGYLQFTYNQQKSQSDSLGDPSDFDDYLVTLGVTHVFQPIKLW